MQNRSYISIFNRLLLLGGFLAFLAPVLVAENTLVPLYSSQHAQMAYAEYAEGASSGRRTLLLGDSTIRNLHAREGNIDRDQHFTNLGAGGSMSKEWYFAFRNMLRKTKDFKATVVGMSNGQAMESADSLPPYYPFLLSVQDAWAEYRSGGMEWTKAARLALYIQSKLLYTKEDLVYGIFSSAFPSLRQFLMDQVIGQKLKEVSVMSAPGGEAPNLSRRFEGIERLKKAAEENGIPIFFVLSPTSEAIRQNTHYRGMQSLFNEACQKLKLQCADYSNKVPDRCFTEDGVHLKEEYAELYKELIEELLKKHRLL